MARFHTRSTQVARAAEMIRKRTTKRPSVDSDSSALPIKLEVSLDDIPSTMPTRGKRIKKKTQLDSALKSIDLLEEVNISGESTGMIVQDE